MKSITKILGRPETAAVIIVLALALVACAVMHVTAPPVIEWALMAVVGGQLGATTPAAPSSSSSAPATAVDDSPEGI